MWLESVQLLSRLYFIRHERRTSSIENGDCKGGFQIARESRTAFFFFLKNEKLSIDRDCKCVATEREKGGSHKERIYKNIDIKLGKYNMYSRDHKQSS